MTTLAAAALCCASVACRAQITLDGSVGVAGTFTGSNFAIRSAYGTQAGGNLFHSFGQFNVFANQTATFYNPSSVTNIIGRVTGPGYSTINGTIRTRLEVGGAPTNTLSTANLWLLNPKGILFGPGALLDVGGSFHVSTADYLKLGSGPGAGIFRASLSATSTLVSAAPSTFGFMGANPQPIYVNGSTLVMRPGRTISLVAGGVAPDGGVQLFNGALVYAESGRINVASVAGPGEIVPAAAALEASAGTVLGDVAIADAGLATSGSAGEDSGAVYLRAGRLELRSGGYIDVSAYESAGAAGRVNVQATDAVLIDGRRPTGFRSGIYAVSFGSGRGGDISIAAPAVTVSNGAVIRGNAAASGDGGTIGLGVGRLEVLSDGSIDVSAASASSGTAGSITVAASEAIVVDGLGGSGLTSIRANTAGSKSGGTISITRAPRLVVKNGGIISAYTLGGSDAGTVTIDGGRVEILSGGSIEAGTYGAGRGGTATVRAAEAVVVDGQGGIPLATGILANARGAGRGGNVVVETPRLTVMNAGTVSSTTQDTGDAGTVTVNVGSLELLGSGAIMSGVLVDGTGGGAGGAISIFARDSILIDGANAAVPGIASSVLALTGGSRRGGDVTVSAPLITLRNGGAILSGTVAGGDAGAITVDAGRLELASGGNIDSSGGEGAGGPVTVRATEAIYVAGRGGTAGMSALPSSISADTSGSATAGDIVISTPLLALADGGNIRSTTIGTGRAGSIRIAAGRVEMRDRALITVQSADDRPPGGPVVAGGPAGSITIDAGSRLMMSGGSRINARTESAPAGDIRIRASELVFLSGSEISTSVAGGHGNGGNIIIDPIFVVLNDSRIIANALRGNGGNITIVSDYFIRSADSLVQASSQFGVSGIITTTAPNVDVSAALAALPSGFFDASLLLRESCAARAGRASNSFTGVGRGGLPASPAQLGFGSYAEAPTATADGGPLRLASAPAVGCR